MKQQSFWMFKIIKMNWNETKSNKKESKQKIIVKGLNYNILQWKIYYSDLSQKHLLIAEILAQSPHPQRQQNNAIMTELSACFVFHQMANGGK